MYITAPHRIRSVTVFDHEFLSKDFLGIIPEPGSGNTALRYDSTMAGKDLMLPSPSKSKGYLILNSLFTTFFAAMYAFKSDKRDPAGGGTQFPLLSHTGCAASRYGVGCRLP